LLQQLATPQQLGPSLAPVRRTGSRWPFHATV
jgi:hypothetical protein